MVVPVNERILVDEALVDKLFRSGHSQIPVAPRAVCQDDRREAPIVEEILKAQLTAEFGRRDEGNAGLLQARVNPAVFLFALFDVPARQTVFNLAVGALILLEDGHADPVIRKYFRRDGAGNRAADYGDEVLPVPWHRPRKPPLWHRKHGDCTPCAFLSSRHPRVSCEPGDPPTDSNSRKKRNLI